MLETDQMEDRYLLQHVQNVGEVSAALLCRRPHQAQVVQVPKPKHANPLHKEAGTAQTINQSGSSYPGYNVSDLYWLWADPRIQAF